MEKEIKVGGRDISLFEGIGGDHEFLCAICQCVPYVSKEVQPCGHMFCDSCITSWLERSKTCAICRQPTSIEQLKNPPVVLRSYIQKMTAFCDNKEYGCTWKSEWSNLPTHLVTCEFAKVSCSRIGCKEIYMRKDEQAHDALCLFKIEKCEYCKASLRAFDRKEHLEVCPEILVECQFCQQKILRKNKKNHIESVCLESPVSCPYLRFGCSCKIKRREIENHLAEEMGLHLLYIITKYSADIEQEKKERKRLEGILEFQILDQKTAITSLKAELHQLKGEKKVNSGDGETEYKTGLALIEKDHWIDSLPYFERAVEADYPPAYVMLYMLREFTVTKEEKDSMRDRTLKKSDWFLKMKSEDPRSQFNLGFCYFLDNDFKKAYEEIIEAANKNYAPAQYLIGYLYFVGKGVVKNEEMAVEFYTKAAKEGFAPAQNNLGKFFTLINNEEKCMEWFKKAAEQGHAVAQYNLAVRYEYSLQMTLALEWCTKSNKQGYAPAQEMLERLQNEIQMYDEKKE